MPVLPKLKADANWELVTGKYFEVPTGHLNLPHLRGKPPLVNFVIYHCPNDGNIVVRHNLMNEGEFLRLNTPKNISQTAAKQFVLEHDAKVRRGDFL